MSKYCHRTLLQGSLRALLLDAKEDILAKKEQVTGSWRKLHTQKLHNVYSLPNVIEVIKQRMTKWTGYVYCIWEKRNVYRLLMEKPEEETGIRRPICQWRIILKQITKKHGERVWTGFMWLWTATSSRLL
jgi:hypothetical protein